MAEGNLLEGMRDEVISSMRDAPETGIPEEDPGIPEDLEPMDSIEYSLSVSALLEEKKKTSQ